jgi:FixJ family two-component response regulator
LDRTTTAARLPLFVVEDDPAVVAAIHRLLGDAWQVIAAKTLKDARVALEGARRLAGAVLDVGLPDGSGLDLLESMRDHYPQLPVLIITAQAEPEIINRAQVMGVEFVAKPNFADGLLAFVSRLERPDGNSGRDEERIAGEIDAFAARHHLSPRERQILELTVGDRSRQEIAEALGISIYTVKAHVHCILNKSTERSLSNLARRIRSGSRPPKP